MTKYSHRKVETKELRQHLPEDEYDIDYDVERFDYKIARHSDGVAVTLHKEVIYYNKPEDLPGVIEELFREAESEQATEG